MRPLTEPQELGVAILVSFIAYVIACLVMVF